MNDEERKKSNRESVKKYREKIKNNPEEYKLYKERKKLQYKKYIDNLKLNPEEYAKFLEKQKISKKKSVALLRQNPDYNKKRNDYLKEYVKNNKDKIKNYSSRTSAEWKKRNIARRYNITIEQYNEMLTSQNGLCLLCDKEPKKIVVDHCHKTGKVRGLLCDECNRGIGLLKENVEVLQKAISYLNKHKG